jgi:hypothetical protein
MERAKIEKSAAEALSDLAMSPVEDPGAAGTTTEQTPAAEGAVQGEPTVAGEQAAVETGAAPEGAGEAGDDAEWGKVTPQQRQVFEKRLGKEVAKTKTERERTEAMTTKVGELEGELTSLKAAVEANVPLHPEWAEKSDLETIAAVNRLEAEAVRLKKAWAGIESEDPAKAMTAEEVQQAYATTVAELQALKPKANQAWTKAQRQFVEDAKLGRQIRTERAKAAELAAKAKAEEPGRATAPVMPAGQGAAGRAASDRAPMRGMSKDRFDKAGGSREAAEKELSELVAV